MKKILAVAVALLLPLTASAAPATYAVTSSGVKGTCGATTCDAPTLVTEGVALQGGPSICAVAVIVEAATALTAGGTVQAYVWNPESAATNKWARWADGDCTLTAVVAHACSASYVPVSTKGSRVVWVATGAGLASITYMHPQPCK